MKRVLKWVSLTFAGFIGLIVIAVTVMYFVAGSRFNRTFEVTPAAVKIPSGPASIEKGLHIARSYGLCAECHGENMAGRIREDDPLFGRFVAPNLTTGRDGIGSEYADIDFVRSIRHSVRPDGRPIIFMPSEALNYLSDSDLGAVIAYVRRLDPVDNELPETSVGILGRVFYFLGFPPLGAEHIDHAGPRAAAPQPGLTRAYGQYLARVCAACHESDYTGGFAPDLTSGGNLATWAEEDFIRTVRSGTTPDGRILNANDMPWVSIGRSTDDELKAIWLFLGSLPAS